MKEFFKLRCCFHITLAFILIHLYTLVILHRKPNKFSPSSLSCDQISPSEPVHTVSDVEPELLDWDTLNSLYPEINGGEYIPKFCTSNNETTSIIIPYRNRENHLRKYLHRMHHVLKSQNLHYKIYVVEQNNTGWFNRAKLINIGFLEAEKDNHWRCAMIHDVDYVLTDGRCLYRCTSKMSPILYAVNLDGKPTYKKFLSGAVQVPRKLYKSVNGFSNEYFGWGGEDDDFRLRLETTSNITRTGNNFCTYHELEHNHNTHDNGNLVNVNRFKTLKNALARMRHDGLNSIQYEAKREVYKLYTKIIAKFDAPDPPSIEETFCMSRKENGKFHRNNWLANVRSEEKIIEDFQSLKDLKEVSYKHDKYLKSVMEGGEYHSVPKLWEMLQFRFSAIFKNLLSYFKRWPSTLS